MEKCSINKSIKEVEYGITLMLERYWYVRNKLNHTSAYTNEETKERLELIIEREVLGNSLRMLGIQDFEIKSEWINFCID